MVNEVFVDAKCSVILAITNFARACPKEFMEYLPVVADIIFKTTRSILQTAIIHTLNLS